MKLTELLHPFLFLFASIMFLYPQSSVIASPDQIIRPLIVLTALLSVLLLPAYKITKDFKLTGILLTIFVLGLCANFIFSLTVLATLTIASLVWLGCLVAWKYQASTDQMIRLTNLVGLLFLIYYTISFFSQLPSLPESYYARIRQKDQFHMQYIGSNDMLPDIYYIVLDGYARADILKELYQFDNSDFLQVLKTRGFIIPDESRSNYPKTALSITSTLNMEYISALAPGFDDYKYWWLMSPLIDQSRIRTVLETAGYQSVSIATDWGITNNPTSSIYYSPFPVMLTDYESFLLDSTPLSFLKPILAQFVFVPSYPAHRHLVEYNFRTLAKIPELPGAKFTFAHIIAPHPPFVFDADGNSLDPGYPFSFNEANDFPLDDQYYREGYVSQLQFINSQLELLIEDLIAKSRIPPIILLQADHGPGMFTDFRSSENTCLRERFGAFAAYYLPGVDPESVPDDITPVNLFRIVLSEYFDVQIPLLENTYYYYKDTTYIFRAEDVTNFVDTCTLP